MGVNTPDRLRVEREWCVVFTSLTESRWRQSNSSTNGIRLLEFQKSVSPHYLGDHVGSIAIHSFIR